MWYGGDHGWSWNWILSQRVLYSSDLEILKCCQLRARRALTLFNDRAYYLHRHLYSNSALLVLSHRLLYSNSALLVLNGTSLNSINALLALNWWCMLCWWSLWYNLNVQKLFQCYLILKLLDSMHRHGWPFHSKHFENELFVKYCIPREFLKVSSQILSK